MKLSTSLLPLLASGALALPKPQNPDSKAAAPNGQISGSMEIQQQWSSSGGGQRKEVFVQEIGPGFSILLAVETSPTGEKAIVAWAYGRSQCVERQLVSKGLNFCGKWLEFNRVPELDPGLQATGDWEQVYVTFIGCDDRSRNGDYSNIFMAVFVPAEYEQNFSPNPQGQLGGQFPQTLPGQQGQAPSLPQGFPQSLGALGQQGQAPSLPQGFPQSLGALGQQNQQGQAPSLPQGFPQSLGALGQQNQQGQAPSLPQGFPQSLGALGQQNQPQALGRVGQPQGQPQPQPNFQGLANLPNLQNLPNLNLQQNQVPGGQSGQPLGFQLNQQGNRPPQILPAPAGVQQTNIQQNGGNELPTAQFGTMPALPQTNPIQPHKPGRPVPETALDQLPTKLPIDAMQKAGLPTGQQTQGQPQIAQHPQDASQNNAQLSQINTNNNAASGGVDPATGNQLSANWDTSGDEDQDGSDGSGVGGFDGTGLDWFGWVGWYVEIYECNSDRELHGCNYEGKESTDLTTFLSCGEYAYTEDRTPEDVKEHGGASKGQDQQQGQQQQQAAGTQGDGKNGAAKQYN